MISVVAHSVFLSIIYCMMTEKYTTEVSLTNVDKPARLASSVFVKVNQNNYKYQDGNAVQTGEAIWNPQISVSNSTNFSEQPIFKY